MLVKEVAKQLGITFDMVEEIFRDDYTLEDAERFWNGKWEDALGTWLYYAPLYNLFKEKEDEAFKV